MLFLVTLLYLMGTDVLTSKIMVAMDGAVNKIAMESITTISGKDYD